MQLRHLIIEHVQFSVKPRRPGGMAVHHRATAPLANERASLRA
jgi:hypothetical protein